MKITCRQLISFRKSHVFKSDSWCFRLLNKFQDNTGIFIKRAHVSRLSSRLLWLWEHIERVSKNWESSKQHCIWVQMKEYLNIQHWNIGYFSSIALFYFSYLILWKQCKKCQKFLLWAWITPTSTMVSKTYNL